MRLLGIDLESTGVDPETARITEIGLCLWDTDQNAPITTHSFFLFDPSYEEALSHETCQMMKKVCGLSASTLREFGVKPELVFSWINDFASKHEVDYLVAHKGQEYDLPLLHAELARNGMRCDFLEKLPLIDTLYDLPFNEEPGSRKLKYMALDAGFIPLFQHRALFDVLTMLKIVACFPIENIIAFQQIPFVVARALVRRDENYLAREQRFSWERVGNDRFPGCWVKRIRENKFEDLKNACKFQVVKIE